MALDYEWLDVYDVAKIYGITPSAVWKRLKRDSKFPKPYRTGPKRTRWKPGEVEEHIESTKAG